MTYFKSQFIIYKRGRKPEFIAGEVPWSPMNIKKNVQPWLHITFNQKQETSK